MTLYNLPVSGPGVLLVHAGDGPGIIVNRDLVNSVILGNNPAQLGILSSILDPLTFVQYSGDVDVYGLATTAVVTVDVMSEVQNWSPSPAQSAASIAASGIATAANQLAGTNAINNPAYGPATLTRQIAQETNIPANIAVTGTPLLNLGVQILNAAVTTVNAGTTTNFPAASTLAFNQPGMEIILQIESVGPTSVANVKMNWLDGGGNPLSTDSYWIYAGTTGNPHALYAFGPVDGLQVVISITAYTAAVKVDKLLVYSNSKLYQRWQFESTSMPALANTFGLSLIEPAAGVIGRRAPASIAAAATDTTCLGLYVGKAFLLGNTGSGTNDGTFRIQNISDQFGQDFICIFKSDGAGNVNQYVQFPRAQCVISMINGNAGAQTMRYQIVTVDY